MELVLKKMISIRMLLVLQWCHIYSISRDEGLSKYLYEHWFVKIYPLPKFVGGMAYNSVSDLLRIYCIRTLEIVAWFEFIDFYYFIEKQRSTSKIRFHGCGGRAQQGIIGSVGHKTRLSNYMFT